MNGTNGIALSLTLNGVAYILLVLICIGISWWGLQQFRFDLFLRNPRSLPARLLMVLLSIALGHEVAGFFISYFNWTQMIRGVF